MSLSPFLTVCSGMIHCRQVLSVRLDVCVCACEYQYQYACWQICRKVRSEHSFPFESENRAAEITFLFFIFFFTLFIFSSLLFRFSFTKGAKINSSFFPEYLFCHRFFFSFFNYGALWASTTSDWFENWQNVLFQWHLIQEKGGWKRESSQCSFFRYWLFHPLHTRDYRPVCGNDDIILLYDRSGPSHVDQLHCNCERWNVKINGQNMKRNEMKRKQNEEIYEYNLNEAVNKYLFHKLNTLHIHTHFKWPSTKCDIIY